MAIKHIPRRELLLFVVIPAGVLCLLVALSVTVNARDTAAPYLPSKQGKVPVRLTIDAIHVDALIDTVGETAQGAVDVPKDPAHAAWFDQSAIPGEVGSSVIDGHYGWKGGTKAVFDNLSSLRVGDEIFVQDGNGTTMKFVVKELRSVASDARVPAIFNSRDGKSHLNIITCEGTWNASEHSYSDRLVVFADKE